MYHGWSHTDAILEGPFEGDRRLFEDILQAITNLPDLEPTEKSHTELIVEHGVHDSQLTANDVSEEDREGAKPNMVNSCRSHTAPLIPLSQPPSTSSSQDQDLTCRKAIVPRAIVQLARSLNPF